MSWRGACIRTHLSGGVRIAGISSFRSPSRIRVGGKPHCFIVKYFCALVVLLWFACGGWRVSAGPDRVFMLQLPYRASVRLICVSNVEVPELSVNWVGVVLGNTTWISPTVLLTLSEGDVMLTFACSSSDATELNDADTGATPLP